MVYLMIGWAILVAVVFARDLVDEIRRGREARAKQVSRAVLEENVATADEYEIAFIKGDELLARLMALQHLVKSGYYDKVNARLVPNTEKDRAPLAEFEKAMLLLQVRTACGDVRFSGDETPVRALLDRYAQKARDLNLFYERPLLAGRTVMLFVLVLVYLLSWKTWNPWPQLPVGGLIAAAVPFLWWRQRVHRRPTIMVKEGDTSVPDTLSEHILTRNGREYVRLFETTHYPIDEKLAEAMEACLSACSLLE